MAVAQPPRPVSTVAEVRPAPLAGRTELGRISIADTVVTKIAARAAAENPDAGAAVARVLGRAVPGAGQLGVRGTDLSALPKTSVQVDGSKAFVTVEIAVRWPASVPEVTGQVRHQVRDRVRELAGLEVDEVHIVVADLATDIIPPPRVRLRREPRMRLLNRPLAFILATALLAGSVVVIAEVIGFAVHRSPLLVHWSSWYHWAQKTGWDALVIRVWSAILIVIGVLLLALELKPRRATRLPLRSADDATDAAVTRRSLAGMLRAAAIGVDGISSATVKVRRRRARIIAASAARGRPAASALTDPVTQALHDRLDRLDLRHPPRLKVHVVPRSR
jgi:uncharacterized alkaline shock family protein YloU